MLLHIFIQLLVESIGESLTPASPTRQQQTQTQTQTQTHSPTGPRTPHTAQPEEDDGGLTTSATRNKRAAGFTIPWMKLDTAQKKYKNFSSF